MKIVIVEFPDATDTSQFTVNSTVSVTKGTAVVSGGIVTMAGSVQNDTAVAHTHSIPSASIPANTTGPAI